mgnify:CR=1 FL=1
MVKGKLITEGRFDEIEKLTREAAEIVKDNKRIIKWKKI